MFNAPLLLQGFKYRFVALHFGFLLTAGFIEAIDERTVIDQLMGKNTLAQLPLRM